MVKLPIQETTPNRPTDNDVIIFKDKPQVVANEQVAVVGPPDEKSPNNNDVDEAVNSESSSPPPDDNLKTRS